MGSDPYHIKNVLNSEIFKVLTCKMSVKKCIIYIYGKTTKEIKMSVATATYKVGDTFTTQKSKVTGTIEEIIPQANGNVRVKLMVEGKPRYTTWTAK